MHRAILRNHLNLFGVRSSWGTKRQGLEPRNDGHIDHTTCKAVNSRACQWFPKAKWAAQTFMCEVLPLFSITV